MKCQTNCGSPDCDQGCLRTDNAPEKKNALAGSAEPAKSAGPAAQAVVAAPALNPEVAAILSGTRLCRGCRHAYRPLGRSWDAADCLRPGLPVNLVTGLRRFPCIIARGYPQLCGPVGAAWESR